MNNRVFCRVKGPLTLVALLIVGSLLLVSRGMCRSSEGQQKGKAKRAVSEPGALDMAIRWEFSTAASIALTTTSAGKASVSGSTVTVPVRLGYFVTKNFEIEPELLFERTSLEETSQSTLSCFGNAAYNFPSASRVTPFVLAGVGLQSVSASSGSASETESCFAFNGGGGVKFFVSDKAALRLEYRLVFFKSGESEAKTNTTIHRILAGLSLFF